MELPPLAYEAHVRPGAPRVVRDVLDAGFQHVVRDVLDACIDSCKRTG